MPKPNIKSRSSETTHTGNLQFPDGSRVKARYKTPSKKSKDYSETFWVSPQGVNQHMWIPTSFIQKQ
jgi:hypothetical protein